MFQRNSFHQGIILIFTLLFAMVSVAASPAKSESLDTRYGSQESISDMMYGDQVISLSKSIDSEVEEALENSWIKLPDGEIQHDKNIFNILLLGTDLKAWETDRGRADATMLCSLNLKTGEIKLVSFERGLFVPIPGRDADLLTHAYSYGGAELSVSLIEHLFLIKIDGYAQVDFESFPPIIDMIGGVDIELTEIEALALNGETITNAWTENNVHEGWNHLNGNDALAYCRLRFTDDDWKRQERQRNTLSACKKQLRELNAFEMLKVLREVIPLINTDIGAGDISKLIFHANALMNGSLDTLQVPDKNRVYDAISCDYDYETKKISNFIFGTDYEIESPYITSRG